jgi:hypothetical protein
VAVVDHQEAETDEDWAVGVDRQGQAGQEDTQRMGVVEDAAGDVAAVGDVVAVDAVVAAVGNAVVVEDHGAVVGLVH